jgi:hypothetical protein
MNPCFEHSSKLTSTVNAYAFYMEMFCENKKASADQTYLDSVLRSLCQSNAVEIVPVPRLLVDQPISMNLALHHLQVVQILTIHMQFHPLLHLFNNPPSPRSSSYTIGKN